MTAFINGNIITLDNNNKLCEAFYVEHGIFKAVGTTREILSLCKPCDDVFDFKGNTVVPGFNDAHMHFLTYAAQKNNINLLNVGSINDMVRASQEYIKNRSIPNDAWVLSRGWNDNLFSDKRLPNRYDLDKISTDHPIYFARICGHIGVFNSKALQLLNIDSSSQNPNGGIIDKENGIPTGILRENALNIVSDFLPTMPKEQIKILLKSAFMDALKVGITTIQTEDLTECGSIDNLLCAYRELENDGAIPLRFILQLNLPSVKSMSKAISLGLHSNIGSNMLKIGPIKLFEDGSLGARTASMKKEYCDDDTTGVLIYNQASLNHITKLAHNAGFQISIHAIGDNAIETILNSYEKIISISSNKDLRLTIVHCTFTNEEILNKFKKLNIIANVQPTFVMSDHPIVEKAVGKTRSNNSYAFKHMLSLNIPIAFSSDAPIELFNPMQGIYAAVIRKDLLGNPTCGFNNTENLTVVEALKAYTIGPSYMSFEEDIKGSISLGKLADFVVLSEDIMHCKPHNIKDINVLETYVGGIKMF
ncbi:amidohydrolase [Clostridium algoriphilum]|uniref:amidohydrolase n=1 Tax=Clostridium algoriphilum TaxID=198347 RepID=UPI001CF46D02|nr:amidohydrolase [Clostridium algoriphilum]MCB2293024.1 amidohydrolase [Clostridium algoriphilum]